ncbi:MAG: hypothetical protein AAF664_18985 [Planctomycetota bacterium]
MTDSSNSRHVSLSPLVGMMMAICVIFIAGGATCARSPSALPYPPPPPVSISAIPTVAEVAAAVNRSDAIQQLASNTTSIKVTSMPGLPRLRGTANLVRPRNLRLKAGVPLTLGANIDLGSNDQAFWFEIPEGAALQRTLYWANHAEYARSMHRSFLPVSPDFISESMGLVRLNAADVIGAPTYRADGRLEVRTSMSGSAVPMQRVMGIDATGGYVTDMTVIDPNGRVVARSTTAEHVYYPAVGAVLPHSVSLEFFPATGEALSLQVTTSQYVINQLLTNDPNLFSMPTDSAASFNLAEPIPPSFGRNLPTTPSAYTADAGLGINLR